MENKSHALAAGAFVLALMAILIGLAVFLTRDKGSYDPFELTTKDTVTGLQPQAQVRYKGVTVGKVTSIGFDQQVPGNVLIKLDVQEGAPLSPTTFASLAYQGVTGLAFIQLDDDEQPQEKVPPGADGIPRLPMKTSQLGKLTESLPEILSQVNDATKALSNLLNADNQKKMVGALDNLSAAAAGAARMTDHIDATITKRLDPALAAVPGVLRDTSKTMRSLRGAADNIGSAAAEATITARRLNAKNGPIDQLAAGTEALGHAVDVIGNTTLPRINRVSDDASHAMRQLSRTVTRINDNPQSLIFGNGQARPGPGEAGFVAPTGAAPAGTVPSFSTAPAPGQVPAAAGPRR
jgi:phospholipid/cholesterol/gamma-HCH transport system substrate-binding protein